MEQNITPLPGSAPPADSASHDQLSSRSDSSLPPHLRASIINVPVTPGISKDTYRSSPAPDLEASNQQDTQTLSGSADRDVTGQPEDAADNRESTALGSGRDIIQRISLAAMARRRESLSDIRSINPDLSLSGSIISATFNIPYSLKYRPGADWVSLLLSTSCRVVLVDGWQRGWPCSHCNRYWDPAAGNLRSSTRSPTFPPTKRHGTTRWWHGLARSSRRRLSSPLPSHRQLRQRISPPLAPCRPRFPSMTKLRALPSREEPTAYGFPTKISCAWSTSFPTGKRSRRCPCG